jgi:hypothetical protein
VQEASPMFACPRGRCRMHLRRAARVSHGRTVGICYSPISPSSSFLRYQRLRASFLPRAFAAANRPRGPRGAALAELFAKSAPLALIIPQAMNPLRPARSNRSWPRGSAMLQQGTPQFSLRRFRDGSSVASSCS